MVMTKSPWKKKTLFILIVLGVVILSSCGSGNQGTLSVSSDARLLLDTVVDLKIYSADKDAQAIVNDAFALISELELRLSRHKANSEISQLNDTVVGEAVELSAETLEVLEAGLYYADLSLGAFDPSIGAVVDLWGIGTEDAAIPDSDKLAAALSTVDYRQIQLNMETGTATRLQDGSVLDLGGVAKGWIADEVAAFFQSRGVEHILVNLGGNILVSGGKGENQPFRIGMQNPFDDRGQYLGVFTLTDGSVVSSGVYERYFEVDGVRYHHILDSQNGYPVDNGLAAVTVISPESITGDALSTALFALGLDSGLALAESLEGIEAAFVTKDKRIVMTAGAGAIYSHRRDDIPLDIRPAS